MHTLALATPVHDVTHAECKSPTTKPKRVFDEFEGFGSPMPNFKIGEQLLNEKCDAFGFSTPVPKMRMQPFDDCISTAAPSPAVTDISSAWTTPTPGCSAPSFLEIPKASWGVDRAPSFEHHLKLDDISAQSGQAFKTFPAPPLGECGMISCIERACKEVFPGPSSSKDFGAGFGWPYNPSNLSLPLPPISSSSLLDQTTPPGTPRKRTVPAPLVTPQVRHYSKTTPPPPPKAAAMPPLLRSLHENSIDAVQSVLEEDTHAATSLFWEHNVEPPLCTAVRLGCSPEVVGLLLEHQADVDGLDVCGRTPLAILASRSAQGCWQGPNFGDSRRASAQADAVDEKHMTIEKLLIQAGADQNHRSIAAARRPQPAIRPFNGTAQTSVPLSWAMDIDFAAILREPPPHL